MGLSPLPISSDQIIRGSSLTDFFITTSSDGVPRSKYKIAQSSDISLGPLNSEAYSNFVNFGMLPFGVDLSEYDAIRLADGSYVDASGTKLSVDESGNFITPDGSILLSKVTVFGTARPKSLIAEMNRVMRGNNNMDKTLDEFLLHVAVDHQEYFVQRLKEYEAMLHMIGVLSGAIGTDEETEELREQLIKQIEIYISGLPGVSDEYEGVPDLGAILVAGAMRLAGYDEDADKTIEASKYANKVETDFQMKIGQMVIDFANSMWDSLVNWWTEFWSTYENEGLLIAMSRLHVDLTFFAAECAIDIGISIALAEVGGPAVAAGLKSLRIVGARAGKQTTRIIIKALPDGKFPHPNNTKLMERIVPDSKIDPQIDKLMDEDRFGGAGKLQETEARSQPKPTSPKTTRVKGRRGKNEVEWELDQNGHVDGATATLREDYGKTPRSSAEKKAQNEAGRGGRGLSDDDGGHVIGHRFIGDQGSKNLFPQNFHFNRGPYNQLEKEWAESIANGYEVKVVVKLKPPGTARPDSVDIQWQYMKDGQTVGKPKKRNFPNQEGNSYKSNPFRE